MPDEPPPKARESHPAIAGRIDAAPQPKRKARAVKNTRITGLRCLTNFTFLEGASHPDELIGQAAALGYEALAVTDRNSLAGVVRAHVAAKQVGLKLIIGTELHLVDTPPLIVWATDRKSYGQLCRLLTTGRRAAKKGECRLTLENVSRYSAGLIAGVPLAALIGDPDHALRSLSAYRDIFSSRLYTLAELSRGPEDRLTLTRMSSLAKQAGLPLAAGDDVRYHEQQRRHLHGVLTAIRLGKPVAELASHLPPNGYHHIRSRDELDRLYQDRPDALRRAVEIADRCHFNLDELRYEYPEELTPAGHTPYSYLKELTEVGASRRYPHGIPGSVRRLLDHELKLIRELRYEAYFLTVQDIVRFARSKEILCQGRGSAANSAVCYCLGVTEVDPDQHDLLFERFISKERDEAPDIDIDFEHERREEVLQYLYEKYGRERAGLAATVVTYRARSAIRDIGKALGLSLDRVDTLARHIGRYGVEGDINDRFLEAGLQPGSRTAKQLVYFMDQILGFPRHLSQHVGGMVMTRGRLDELCVIENASMKDRTVVQWEKDDLEALGILKVDCLALGMLTALKRCFELLKSARTHGAVPVGLMSPQSLCEIPKEDPTVYEMIQRADTMGVFQIESRAQMAMLPRLKPRTFYDLVIEVAIVRPGPIQGDMVHPYLRRRDGLEEETYPSDEVRGVLQRTLGVPIFQEQAMKLAQVAAGFSPGEADEFRRAIGAWRSTGKIDEFEHRLKEGMSRNGYTGEFAERLFKQIRGFGEYGFPESHAASFAILVYYSCWLKCYYPAAFCAALVNSQPMGFYSPSQLIRDARQHDVEVRPVCVNRSQWDCTLELADNLEPPRHGVQTQGGSSTIRLGLRMVRGLRQADAERLLAARTASNFASFDELARRTGLASSALDRLAAADAFRELKLKRREARWQAMPSRRAAPLTDRVDQSEETPTLPFESKEAGVAADYRATGLSLEGHPLQFLRNEMDHLQVTTAELLQERHDGQSIKVAGLILLRQRPGTAKGVTFMTIEDETGHANLIVWPDVWEKFHRIARTATAVIAHGKLQRDKTGYVIHVVVDRLEDLSETVAAAVRSRDFH
ncbi:error-prone DNA polymerase [Stratiformator vulcanicus]|uniref:Error-prone DNA polymerase n=1 Tax=Stratiformator vulcanicus TaxID=2527980 RepID=A0A517QXS0_9PLAN|nr:error-prone DNA polymerase [Stratiformator vulcanicus]QDT36404.1 Error-prone DNA polymerase [Stratiformator vulcanicus]